MDERKRAYMRWNIIEKERRECGSFLKHSVASLQI